MQIILLPLQTRIDFNFDGTQDLCSLVHQERTQGVDSRWHMCRHRLHSGL